MLSDTVFKDLPRYVGFPNQVFVKKRFAFDNFYKTFNGKAPFFVSTYQFKDKLTPIIDNILFDIDSYFGLRIPYNNTKAIKRFCDRKDIPYIIDFSGGKGFHFFMIIKDIIPRTPAEQESIKDTIYSIQVELSKKYKIQAVDYPTFGRSHFLVRYPTSKYVRHGEQNGLYCRYIEADDFDKGIKHIAKLVREKGELPKKPKAQHTLQDIIEFIPNFKLHDRKNGEDLIELIRSEMQPPTHNALMLPCMKELVTHGHPPHYERVELVAWLKWLGYTDTAIISFIENQHWTRYKREKTRYQVSTIKGRYPDCKKLEESYSELCEEGKCPFRKK